MNCGVKMSLHSLSQLAVWVNPSQDNVAVAKRDLQAGLILDENPLRLTLTTNIPCGHRFAIYDIPEGKELKQYGQPFALSRGIFSGDYVSEKNTINLPEIPNNNIHRKRSSLPPWQGEKPTFNGYLRPNGQAGTRNWVVVIPTSMCSSHEARLIAETAEQNGLYNHKKWNNVNGVTCIPHTFGCGCMDSDPDEQFPRLGELNTTLTALSEVIRHSNVGAVLLIELGCEKTNLAELTKWITGKSTNPADLTSAVHKSVDFISIQQSGGTKAAIKKGLSAIEHLLEDANQNKRQTLPLEKLVLGLKCGGSDAFSGITANPALGEASDLLIRAGGYSLITEIPEFFGAEHLFAARAINDKVEKDIVSALNRFRKYLQASGGSFEDNPSPGNRTGGLMNVTIKALGAGRHRSVVFWII
jgi:altronate hydrolase